MPSLDALRKFKSSFNDIANEKADVLSLQIPFDDLELPDSEPAPMDFSSRAEPGKSAPAASDDLNFNELLGGESPPPMDVSDEDTMAAFGDFFKDLSSAAEGKDVQAAGDISDLTDGGQNTEHLNVEDFGAEDFEINNFGQDSSGSDDFSAEGLDIDGFGDESSNAADSGADPADDFSTDDFGEEGAQDFGIQDSGGFEAEDPGIENFAMEDFDMGSPEEAKVIDLGGEEPFVDPASDDFETTDFPVEDIPSDFEEGSIDMGGEAPAYPIEGLETDSSDFSMDDLTDDFNLPIDESFSGGETLPDMDIPPLADADLGSDDFSLPDFPAEEAADASFDDSLFEPKADGGTDPLNEDFSFFSGDGDSAPDSGSIPDLGDFGSDFDTESIDIDLGASGDSELSGKAEPLESHDVFGGDDFSLPGLDDIFEKNKIQPLPAQPDAKKGLFGKKKGKDEAAPDAEENIEEISLSQDDVDNLMDTLSKYPLNLRILCEEIIAEQVILPAQLAKLIRLLVNGAHVKETAAHVEQITGNPVVIPKSFEKMTGAAFEAEQASFAYIFVHNFLPVFRLFSFIALVAASVLYLGYQFIYKPVHAESLYRRGYERIPAGEYERANELFNQAFEMHRKKKWFYAYAEAFAGQRRFQLAENKYDQLLYHYPRDKKGVLDYAALNTNLLLNFEKANRLLQRQLLDYAPNDYDGLLAAGDNFLAWADSNPSRFSERYEDARFSYARLLELRGWLPPIVERMLLYFIRTDNLREVLSLRAWFDGYDKRRLAVETRAELGGYLLDKQLEKPSGVPDPYVESIESVRNMLLQAVMEDPYLPEPHYHLARYHNSLGNTYEERLTLENSIRAFDLAGTESVRRRLYRVDAHYRYANLLINNKEFFPAEEHTVRSIQLFEDFVSRNHIAASPQLGRLYALQGDLEYFVKTGDMQAALRNYHTAEGYGYSPPEIQYRMGAAYYQQEDFRTSLEYLFKASAELPLNRRLLFALGNAAFQRGDYFAAQGYYGRLLDILEMQRIRLPVLLPNDSEAFLETGERLMMARNNMGVVYEAVADQTGNRDFRTQALIMYAESSRAWDAITRNPELMTRMRLADSPGAPSINLGYLNANNALRPNTDYRPQIFTRFDRDVLEPSRWEELIR